MKKYLLIATVTLGLAFTACSSGQKTETAPATTDAAQPVVTATVDSAAVTVDSTAVKVDSACVKK